MALIFWISKVLPPCTIKNAKFHILDIHVKVIFFPTQTLYNTHQNILHNIHNLHEETGGNFGWLSKMTIIAGCRFESLPLKMMFWQKKSLADLISCVYIFIILQKLDMPKTSYIYTSPSSEIWWSISELWIKGLNIGKTNHKSFVEEHILSCVLNWSWK